jgi:hypothetical protein
MALRTDLPADLPYFAILNPLYSVSVACLDIMSGHANAVGAEPGSVQVRRP